MYKLVKYSQHAKSYDICTNFMSDQNIDIQLYLFVVIIVTNYN